MTVKDSTGNVVADLSVVVRVHLDGNFGTAFPANLGLPNKPNQSAINTYLANTFAWGGNVPATWSNLPANVDQTYQTVLGLEKRPSQARLQYVVPANQRPGAATRYLAPPRFPAILLAITTVSDGAFAYNAEELKAILAHESKHVRQISDVINQPTSLFARLAGQVGFQSDDYTDLAELEGHCTDLTDSGVSWRFLAVAPEEMQSIVIGFKNAIDTVKLFPAGAVKTDALAFCRAEYDLVVSTFPQMGDSSYDYYLGKRP